MRKNKLKIILILLIVLSIMSIGVNTYGHPGRTDANGGHKDPKNVSGLGSYHYHCGGNPAHLHTNGSCPYSSSSSAPKSSSSASKSSSSGSKKSSSSTKKSSSRVTNSSSSSSKSTEVKSTVPAPLPATVPVIAIKINENITSMQEGNSKKLTATIYPENATDKNFSWKSSDENIATVNLAGEVIAKKSGTVDITATSSNGTKNTITMTVEKSPTSKKSYLASAHPTNTNKDSNNNNGKSNPLVGTITLGLLGVGSYLGYKIYNIYNDL